MKFLKKNLSLIIIFGAIGAYVVFAGTSGICPTCTVVTDFVGLSHSDQIVTGDSVSGESAQWTVAGLDGQAISGAELEGKVVILDFWATWCPPCRKEIPGFIELQEQYADRGLVILGLSLDQDGPEVVREFIRDLGVNYPIAMANREIVELFGGVKALPTTFIIDREGVVVNRHVGYASKAVFEADIKELL